MIILPIETEGHAKDRLIVVLTKANIDRMKQADPAEIPLREIPRRLVEPVIMLCYEEDEAALMRVVNKGDIKATIKYLQRGWKFRPDKGDHDRGPEPIAGQQ